jgi:hypothetical protein
MMMMLAGIQVSRVAVTAASHLTEEARGIFDRKKNK